MTMKEERIRISFFVQAKRADKNGMVPISGLAHHAIALGQVQSFLSKPSLVLTAIQHIS